MYLINKQKIKILDPKEFGLCSRTAVGETVDGKIALLKDRKSRIIMNDGRKILEQILKIKITTSKDVAVCSKTTKFFKEHNIELIQLEKQNV
jgi:hypothetical protein